MTILHLINRDIIISKTLSPMDFLTIYIFFVDCSFYLTHVHICQLSKSGLGQKPLKFL